MKRTYTGLSTPSPRLLQHWSPGDHFLMLCLAADPPSTAAGQQKAALKRRLSDQRSLCPCSDCDYDSAEAVCICECKEQDSRAEKLRMAPKQGFGNLS